MLETQVAIRPPGVAAETTPAIRVVMLDLLAFVPYYTGHLCAGLEQAGGVDVTLASITYQYDREFFRRQGIRNNPGLLDLMSKLDPVPAPLRRALKLLECLANMVALLARIAASRPDVVHVQFLPLLNYGVPFERWLLGAVRMIGARIIYTVHNVLPQDSGDCYRKAYRRLYQMADKLICHDAQSAARLASEFGINSERIDIIPHGSFFEQVRGEARSGLGLAADECTVLWQGILRPYKGVQFLLKAWRQVCASSPRARLVIAGTGDDEMVQAVRDEVAALGIASSVRLDLRFVSVKELADLYGAADILVYPYREITTSGALMTGIVHGKAIVATTLPAFEQLLQDGETGLLVPYGDVDALSRSLLRLIGDPKLRQTLGRRLCESKKHAPGWVDIARRTCACYRAALSAEPRWSGDPVIT
jgi:glycosyltransferase involved in cell wall biosynthesis